MMAHLIRVLTVLSFGLVISIQSAFAMSQDELKEKMIRYLDFVQTQFETSYAPTPWKAKFSGWDLDRVIDEAKERVRQTDPITVRAFQAILSSVINSTKDYHVGIRFAATGSAALPFTVRGTQGRYFITYIDREKLSEASFPFQIGDELIEFGDKPAALAVAEVKKELGYSNVEATDTAFAELLLTKRVASMGFKVPTGPIHITVRPKDSEKPIAYQLTWTSKKEVVSHPFKEMLSRFSFGNGLKPNLNANLPMMTAPMFEPIKSFAAEPDPSWIGTRKSFIPALGKKIWETAESDDFHAYIYQTDDRRLIGYVRIASYMPENSDRFVKSFEQIIAKFEDQTDALVIDQVNNPGGSVFYLYTLASMLTEQALYTPLHRMKITQQEVLMVARMIPELEAINSDAEAKKAMGESFGGYPVSYQLAQFLLGYARFIVSEWDAGRTLTEPSYIWGVDRINPAPTRYTKPILLLTNYLDFSGGDFFPAILQDNKRVTIMGTRTAGAGGYVTSLDTPNIFGIASISLTGSLAERIDQNPIENLGVTPEVPYELNADDYQNNYKGYVNAINSQVRILMDR